MLTYKNHKQDENKADDINSTTMDHDDPLLLFTNTTNTINNTLHSVQHLQKHRMYDSIYVAIRRTTDEITKNSLSNVGWIVVIFRTLRFTAETDSAQQHKPVFSFRNNR